MRKKTTFIVIRKEEFFFQIKLKIIPDSLPIVVESKKQTRIKTEFTGKISRKTSLPTKF